MYAFITGTVEEINQADIVIGNNGIGYTIQCPASVSSTLKLGETRKIYTYQHVREDAILLFGFLTKEDRVMFLRLISVSGIGPKLALQILSSVSSGELAIILVGGDASALTRVPGIGKKTAQRLILELREKIDSSELQHNVDTVTVAAMPSNMINDAVFGLAALGYSASEVTDAIKAVAPNCKSTEEIIRNVLKGLDRR